MDRKILGMILLTFNIYLKLNRRRTSIAWGIITVFCSANSIAQQCDNSRPFTINAMDANTVALVEIDSFLTYDTVNHQMSPISMQVSVIKLINGLDKRDSFIVYGQSRWSYSGAHLSKFTIGEQYILVLHEGKEMEIDGWLETKDDYYISNCGENYLEGSSNIDSVQRLFKYNLFNLANLYPEYTVKNVGEQIFFFDSLYNWFALKNSDSTLQSIGTYDDRRTIRKSGEYFAISKDYDDLTQFYPDPIVDASFNQVKFPVGVYYNNIIYDYFIVVNHDKKHNRMWAEAIFDTKSGEYITGWYKSIRVESFDEAINLVLVARNGDVEKMSLPYYKNW